MEKPTLWRVCLQPPRSLRLPPSSSPRPSPVRCVIMGHGSFHGPQEAAKAALLAKNLADLFKGTTIITKDSE